MALVLRFRGRDVHTEDVETIQALITAGAPSRRALSQQVCQAWGWAQPNGRLCDSTCRKLLLALHVPHLASHLLGRMSRQLSADWERVYAHPVLFAETFVDPTRYRGTCYRAANWVWMGQTTGRGKNDQTHQPNRSLKDVWGYPLVRDFRARLCAVEPSCSATS